MPPTTWCTPLGEADFERRDAEAARTFACAAADVGIRRIVYLGGLGDDADDLSAHLRSRREWRSCSEVLTCQ